MKVISTVSGIKNEMMEGRTSTIGFVPTMGALHEGHLSLVKNAVAKCPVIVVSIFVNPLQFNDKNDLKNYPRTIESDLKMLGEVLRNNDIVFTPGISEIYPEEDTRKFQFGNLDNVMESLHRPGHFNGVAQVVSRLFEIVEPDFAFFGMKDFQQLAVIKALVRQTKDKVKIIPCPIIREKDGLAMSSRNRLLDPEIRKNAPLIFKTLTAASDMIKEKDIPEIRKFVENSINRTKNFFLEYFEIVDDTELRPVSSKEEMMPALQYYGCIAIKAGGIRLIDNIQIGLV
jgi:pantoate--beta-alanine ligase